MKGQENTNLTIGDEIGFVTLSNDIDTADSVFFCKIYAVGTFEGERAYRFQYPDGQKAQRIVRQSDLASHLIRVQTANAPAPDKKELLCLSERVSEFADAIKRGESSDLVVYANFEPDTFVVVNRDNGNEYQINLKTIGGQLHGNCDCADFTFRRRICKHLGAVLTANVFQTLARK